MRDLKDKLAVDQALKPAAARASSPTCTKSDLQGFGSALVVINSGTITDGTHTPKLQESDDDSTYADVAAADLVGSFSDIADDSVQKVSYIGKKRYIKPVVTVSGASTGGLYDIQIVKGHAANGPVA